ncbi:MAG: high-potential iron-sulfur protein [Bdellovibrionota bacterium]
MKKDLSRRSFLQILTTSAAVLPLLKVSKLFAVDMKTLPAKAKALDEKAPMANVLGYKHDATKVDTKRFKKYVAGHNCANCAQYVKKNDSWGECKIIKGGLVYKDGWCNSYLAAKKA